MRGSTSNAGTRNINCALRHLHNLGHCMTLNTPYSSAGLLEWERLRDTVTGEVFTFLIERL